MALSISSQEGCHSQTTHLVQFAHFMTRNEGAASCTS
jgi:hypothetical protein